MKLLTLILVSIFSLFISGCGLGEKTYDSPTTDEVTQSFSDVDVIIPEPTVITTLKRIDSVTGNYIEFTAECDEAQKSRLIALFDNTTIDSKVDADYPWYFQCEYTDYTSTVKIEGRQSYD